MAIYYTESADKHRIPHADIEYAIYHPINKQRVEGRPRDITFIFVGRPHDLSRAFLEIGIAMRPDGRLEVFHASDARTAVHRKQDATCPLSNSSPSSNR